MSYKELFKEQNEDIRERYELSMDRIEQILTEDTVKQPYLDYFKKVASFIIQIKELVTTLDNQDSLTLEEIQEINNRLYADIVGDNYDSSYANPKYAVEKLGNDYGQLLAYLYTEIRAMIVYAHESRHFDITIYNELFIQVYNEFEDEITLYDKVKEIVYQFTSDYSDVMIEYRVREMFDTDLDFAVNIIMNEDLNDLRYLYKYGEYISKNEIKMAEYLNSLPEEDIIAMAKTYVDGYRKGFENSKMDLSKKSSVNVRYNIGFERMVREAIKLFADLGLKPAIFRYAVNSIHKRQHMKIGYSATSPNKQYDYDHRFDNALYFDKAFCELRLSYLRVAYEKYKEKLSKYAGPALIEIFGEVPFNPVNKPECLRLDDKQQALSVEYSSKSGQLANEYIKGHETSFTIIAYPIPEIGDNFEEIFNETIKVNTLDDVLFKEIQQKIIDVLDQADYVNILGTGNNKTDLRVKMHELENKETQTNFENCLADVNIPVGEVFTSPVLAGTNGVLNVSEVFLRDLKFIDLSLTFEDGMIKDYTCKNFDDEDANKKYIKENVLYNHETLPIGEFAIGTNTTAYVMANKYNIVNLLPILIVEKMGPHFAVGDTCFSWREDHQVFNPDGKEIIARDNERSILRKTNISEAYYNCHTDITIPYDEIKEISAVTKDGRKIDIIVDGRFVLEGTEYLNEAFK